MFNVTTICMPYNSEPVVLNSISKLGRNHAMNLNTHTEHLVQKHNDFLQLKRNYLVLNEEKKQGNKTEKLTESLHLTVKIARRSNYNIDLRKLRVNKITSRRNHKAALNEKPTNSTQ